MEEDEEMPLFPKMEVSEEIPLFPKMEVSEEIPLFQKMDESEASTSTDVPSLVRNIYSVPHYY